MNENPTDAQEQYELGEDYYIGNGVPQDYEKARYWYTKAAEQGNADALKGLGTIYSLGKGVLQDNKKATYYHTKAAELFTKAAEQGNAEAQYKLSKMLYNSYSLFGCLTNYKPGNYWMLKAAEQGYADAQYSLGQQYAVGMRDYGGFQQDWKQAVYWYAKAAEQGHSEAQSSLGDCYAHLYSGYGGVPKDLEKANYWYTKAAEQGLAEAQERLGRNYYNGEGVPKDLEKAQYWIALAAKNGNKEAIEDLIKLRTGEPLASRSGCYVATCVYGSYDCQEVLTLRRFRDNELSNLWLGKLFIRIYYATSPKIIELFGNKKWFSRVWKPIIDKIVCKLQTKEMREKAVFESNGTNSFSTCSFQHGVGKNI